MPSSRNDLIQGFNWHPLVHDAFGESLFFYLLRLREPALGPVAEQLRSVLDHSGVRFACEYTVFGHWDGLIRVWLTQSSKKRLLRGFTLPDSNVAEAREFHAGGIRHLWHGSTRDLIAPDSEILEAIAEHRADVVAVASGVETDPVQLTTLRGAGLLLKRPQWPDAGVKFYIALSRTTGDLEPSTELSNVLGAVETAGLSPRASVYAGSGPFADYLVRCVADTFPAVLEDTARLDKGVRELRLRPMTLLVANVNAVESDNINDLRALSTHDEATLRLLELDDSGKELVEALTQEERRALNELVDTAYSLSSGDQRLRSKLRALLRASLLNDRDGLTSSAAFLLEFEWLLSEYLKRAWAEVFGPNDWMMRLAEEFERDGHTREATEVRNPREWTLGSCVTMAVRAADINTQVNAHLTGHLGERWKDQMRVLVEVRNTLAHGRLRTVKRFDEFAGSWGGTLSQLLNVATLHFKCERLIEKEYA